jgi:hypothetical protein
MSKSWFVVDREGLAQTVRRRHPGFIFGELVANSLDQGGTKNVRVMHEPVPGKPQVEVTVTDDDPTGFADLQDAFTLFRRTPKRKNAKVRGRFNLGEKEFLSICASAQIRTTIGTVFFNEDGTRRISRADKDKTAEGTVVSATVKMTREDYERAVEFLEMIIPPEGINLSIYDGAATTSVRPREKDDVNAWMSEHVVGDFEVTLPTEIEDEEGDLRRTKRKSRVLVYTVPDHRDDPWLFEMGIPVCPLPEDSWDIDVQQKVPLARDRDSVTPAYLQAIRVAVVNNCHEDIDEDAAKSGWVTAAIEDDDIEEEAFTKVVHERFGEDAVVYDPSDPEANSKAVAEGRQVIYGGALPKGAHDNRKRFETFQSAGQAFPTSKAVFGPGGNNISIENKTGAMLTLMQYTKWLALKLMDVSLQVDVVRSNQGFAACYGEGSMLYNMRVLGRAWVKSWQKNLARTHEIIIHEFAHEYEENHLSEDYHKACCRIGAKLADLMRDEPHEVEHHLTEKVNVNDD